MRETRTRDGLLEFEERWTYDAMGRLELHERDYGADNLIDNREVYAATCP